MLLTNLNSIGNFSHHYTTLQFTNVNTNYCIMRKTCFSSNLKADYYTQINHYRNYQ